jgi:hypothetical protein
VSVPPDEVPGALVNRDGRGSWDIYYWGRAVGGCPAATFADCTPLGTGRQTI